jgi:hypothetical protein
MFHRFIEVVSDTVRKPDAVEFMRRAWNEVNEVNENVIRRAWGIYEEPDDFSELTDAELLEEDPDE